jgi:hypothetical protein
MGERLGDALAKGGITSPPSSVTWIELVAHRHLGGQGNGSEALNPQPLPP